MKSARNKLYNLGFDEYLTRKYHDYCLLSQYYHKSNIFDNIENIIAILDALSATDVFFIKSNLGQV